jgi:hypothetical protein
LCEHKRDIDWCYQGGVEIIKLYRFETQDGKRLYTLWEGRHWVNGYNEVNVSGGRDGQVQSCDKCGALYEGAIDYNRTDNYDPKNFPPPGSRVYLRMTVYTRCIYNRYGEETQCNGCYLDKSFEYNPPR